MSERPRLRGLFVILRFMPKQIAFFTGTFDPFHIAHSWQLERAYRVHPFDEAVIAVIQHNPKKPHAAPWHHRVELAKRTLATQDLPYAWRVGPIEGVKPATVRTFAATYTNDKKPLRVVGADVITEFFEDPVLRPALKAFTYVVVMRPVSVRAEVDAIVERIKREYNPDFAPEIVEIKQAIGEVSSRKLHSDMSAQAAAGVIVPEAVKYMVEHKLYSFTT